MKLEWQDYLSVGIAEIDQQHKELFDRFNVLQSALIVGKEADEIMRLVKFLDSYAISHFMEEEALMSRIGFPGLDRHREAHLAFKRDITRLKDAILFEGITPRMITSLCQALTAWLIEHISGLDRLIGRFIEKEGPASKK